MSHSLHRAGADTHVRIVVLSLVAGIAIVIGALHAHLDSRVHGDEVRGEAPVIKASRQFVYSSGDRVAVR